MQLGMPLQPVYQQKRALGSTTGGFYPSILEGPKKVSPLTVHPDVKQAVAPFQPYFDPAFFPKVCCHWLRHMLTCPPGQNGD